MARVSLPDGRRKCVYGKTRQEVAQQMTAILRDRAQNLPVADERLTVAAFLDKWLTVAVKPSVRPRTYVSYSMHVRRHIVSRAQQRRERLLAANLWTESGLVFTSVLGKPLDPSNVIHMFHRLLRNAGLRRLRNHDLRHACATLLLAKGLSMRVVMELLGHSQITLTMNTYAHVLPSLLDEAAQGMEEMLGGAR